jgi:hypothetical protein
MESPFSNIIQYFVFIFISFLIDTTNIIDFFDFHNFFDIYFSGLTPINNSIFKPPWRLNGDGAIEGA